jgi:hypothetical protein
MFKGQWRPDMNELRGHVVATCSLQTPLWPSFFGAEVPVAQWISERFVIGEAIGAIGSRVRIRWMAVFHVYDLYPTIQTWYIDHVTLIYRSHGWRYNDGYDTV